MPARKLTPDPQLNLFIGENVRSRRTALGLTQEELGERLGLHRTAIGAIERGRTSPTITTLRLIAEALGMRLTDLFDGYDQLDKDVSPSWTKRVVRR